MKRGLLAVLIVMFLITPAHALYIYEYNYQDTNTNLYLTWKYIGENISGLPFDTEIKLDDTSLLLAEAQYQMARAQIEQIQVGLCTWMEGDTIVGLALSIRTAVSVNAIGTLSTAAIFLPPPQDIIGDYDAHFATGTQDRSQASLSISAAEAPEPWTFVLLCSGLIGLAGFRRKFKK